MKYLLTLLFIISCATVSEKNDGITEVITTKEIKSFSTSEAPSKADANKSLSRIINSTNLRLRGDINANKNSLTAVIEWVRKTKVLAFRLIDDNGESKSYQSKIVSLNSMRSLILKTGASLKLGDVKLTTVNPVRYIASTQGEIEALIDVKISGLKGVKDNLIIPFKYLITFLSYNVQNLWDSNAKNTDDAQMYVYDSFRPEFSNWFTKKVQNGKAKAIIRTLKLAGIPDIVGMQEVEWARGRSDVFKRGSYLRTQLEKLGYKYFIVGDQDQKNPVAITTAFISFYPITKKKSVAFNINEPEFKNFPESAKNTIKWTTRDMQVVELNLDDTKTIFVNNHWRSQGCHDDESCRISKMVRDTNARVVNRAVKRLRGMKNKHDVIVFGDMNLQYSDKSLNALNSGGDKSSAQHDVGTYLYNLWYDLPVLNRWEVGYAGFSQTLSHIMLNGNLYDNHGIQYANNSYRVVGQEEPARSILINADGNPLRFQAHKMNLGEVSKTVRDRINKIIHSRKQCQRKTRSRRCKKYYYHYMGQGYSDHLPLFAAFTFVGSKPKKYGRTNNLESPIEVDESESKVVSSIQECATRKSKLKSYPHVSELKLNDPLNLNKCVIVDYKLKPLPLKTTGIYRSGYIDIGNQRLGLSMTRAFDSREIEDGQPIGSANRRMHDMSHMCYARKVLQGKGGKVSYAVGRLGYMNSMPTLYLSRRENIELVDLPLEKSESCTN